MLTTSLTTSKTPGIIVAEIKMMSPTFSGVHFLVEGDDDCKFWRPRISRCRTSIVNCEGKSNLVGASMLINNLGISSVAGVYDSDFERLFGISYLPNMLASTDENDLEVTIVASSALNTLLHEYGDQNLIENFEKEKGTTVTVHLEQLSSAFGRLRFVNSVLKHGIDFDRLSPYRFVSQDDWSLNQDDLNKEYAALAGITAADLVAAVAAHVPKVNIWGLSQGHDTVRILAQGLKKRIGRKQISEQDVAKILRIAYSVEMLRGSTMYKSLRTIEGSCPVPIFD